MINNSNPENKLSPIASLEALLFVAPSSVTISQLASALAISTTQVEEALQSLETRYLEDPLQHGIRLQRYGGRVMLTSAPQAAQIIERFLGLEISSKLSQAALEALAIILYKQPVTRPQVDAVRGVNSDGVMRTLLQRGLIQEIGRAEAPGRPVLYSATEECIQYFGLSTLADLPPLKIEDQTKNGSTDELLKG